MTKTGKVISKSISILLQPYLMPLYSVALLFLYTNFYDVYNGQWLKFLLPVFVFSFLLPSIFTKLLWKLKYIRTLSLYSQKDRVFPFLIFITSNLSLTYFFYSAGLYGWFLGLTAAPALITLIAFFINFLWKLSAHMLALGGLIGGVFSVCLNVKGVNPVLLFIVLFLLAGALGVSRLYLRRNTPIQLYVGFFVGLLLAYSSVLLGVFAFVLYIK